jgi:hypothetical protein
LSLKAIVLNKTVDPNLISTFDKVGGGSFDGSNQNVGAFGFALLLRGFVS